MGFIISLVVKLVKLFLYFLIFFALVVLIPNLPPYTNFTRIDLEPTLPREGALTLNDALNNVQKLYEDKLLGPEAFQLYDGELYTSLATGEIVKISPGGHVTFVTKIGQPCTGVMQEHICGRPLGFKIDEKNKQLYVADAYLGIWKVDLKTDKKQLLVSPHAEINGCQTKLFNDLALDEGGNLYYTISSCDVLLRDGALGSLLDPSGRVLYYSAAKNESKVLLDNLWFTNGIVVSPDNNYILVVESLRYKIIKYYIRGPKKGQQETFISGLPGAPDNIRALPDGSGVLVALYSSFDEENPLLIKSLASVPLARKFLTRLQRLIELPFEFLNEHYPHIVFEEIVYYIGSLKSVSSLSPQMSGLLQIDWAGNVIASYYNTNGAVKHICDGIVFKDMLLFGNPHVQNFIGGVPAPSLLKQAFIEKKPNIEKDKLKQSEKKESKPQVVQPTPVPPTTTPKPEVKKEIPTPTPEAKKIPTQTPKSEERKATTPKPLEVKAETPKPQEVKASTPKPDIKITSTPRPEEIKTTTSRPEQIKTTTKAEEKKTTAPPRPKESADPASKSSEGKPNATPKPTDTKTTTPKPTESKPVQSKEPESLKTRQPDSKTKTPPNQNDAKPQIPDQKSIPPSQQPESKAKLSNDKPVESKAAPMKADSKTKLPEQTGSKAVPAQQTQDTSAPKQTESQSQKTEGNTKPVKQETKKASSNEKPPREHIPIKEDIPSDTAKPSKDTLKVIKKEGPTEIPNLNP